MQKKTESNKKQDFIEALIVFFVMTGLLLPVRLVFFTFVSTNWFGSFGLISVVSIIMVILVKKKKLGRFGQMFENQLQKVQHGKRAILIYTQSILLLILLAGSILAIELGNSIYSDLKAEIIQELDLMEDPEQMLSEMQELTFQDWMRGFGAMFLAIFFAFPKIAVLLAAINDIFDGWILHLYTVGLVETLEFFGILIFFRFSLKKKEGSYKANKSN